MKILIDGEGGDKAPSEILKGCSLALQEFSDLELLVTGREDKLKAALADAQISSDRLTVVPAEEPLTMEDTPESVVREKKTSSLGTALKMLGEGQADALVSAGNSGALLFGGSLIVRRIKGVKRAAFAPLFPTRTGRVLLLDSGATVDGRPEFLEQYGILGSAYMKAVCGIEKPRVGLANNGAEECKGPELYREAHARLKANPDIHFVGNVECRDFLLGGCDVLVADGFTGNMILKSCEGMGAFLLSEMKGMFTAGFSTKLACLLLKKQLTAFKKKADYRETGGAILLGLTRPVVKAHGSSDAKAFKNSIRQAYLTAKSGVIEELTAVFAAKKEEKTDG